MTTDLMRQINDRITWLALCDASLSQARRLLVLAEVTHGMGSADYRHARLDVRKLELVIGQCTYDLQFAREELARKCEPWFRLEA